MESSGLQRTCLCWVSQRVADSVETDLDPYSVPGMTQQGPVWTVITHKHGREMSSGHFAGKAPSPSLWAREHIRASKAISGSRGTASS